VDKPFFDDDFLRKLEALSLLVRRYARGSFMANRLSEQKGFAGGIFADHRPYSFSDDYRHIDWNAAARLDTLVVKRYQQERNVTVEILIDVSNSMTIGDPSKFDYARRLAAALAYITLDGLDQLAITPFSDDSRVEFPPVRGKGQVVNVLKYLENMRPAAGETDLAASALGVSRKPISQPVLILISDMLDRQGFHVAMDRLRYHSSEVKLVHLYAAEEANPAVHGDLELIDAETTRTRRVTVTQAVRDRYRQAFRNHLSRVREYGVSHGVTCLQACTTTPLDELLFLALK
jgi:uncharacterized protein (DUF58 family)